MPNHVHGQDSTLTDSGSLSGEAPRERGLQPSATVPRPELQRYHRLRSYCQLVRKRPQPHRVTRPFAQPAHACLHYRLNHCTHLITNIRERERERERRVALDATRTSSSSGSSNDTSWPYYTLELLFPRIFHPHHHTTAASGQILLIITCLPLSLTFSPHHYLSASLSLSLSLSLSSSLSSWLITLK